MNKEDTSAKPLYPRSLQFQLLSRSLFFLAIILLFIGIFQYVFMREFIYINRVTSVAAQIRTIPREVWTQWILRAENSGGTYELSTITQESRTAASMRRNPDGNTSGNGTASPSTSGNAQPRTGEGFRLPFFLFDSSIAYVDKDGKMTPLSAPQGGSFTSPLLEKAEYEEAHQSRIWRNYTTARSASGEELLVVLQPIDRNEANGLIQVSLSTGPLKDVLMRQVFVFMLLALLALLGGLIAYRAVLKKTLVPLSKMVEAMEKIDAGNLNVRLPAQQGQLEVDRLAGSVNGMLERLEASFKAEKEAKEQMRRFVADASHELRTPLTSIHGFLEVLLRGAKNQPDKLEKSLRSMYEESGRMKTLVQDLLLLAKLDRSPNLQFEEHSLDKVIRDMEFQMAHLAGKRELSLKLTSGIKLHIDTDKMKQVILNLLQNAVQHTDPVKGRIEVEVIAKGEFVEMSVKDNGSGIAEDHIPHLFERFYRSESSRTRKHGGAGLGLAITQTLVELHGGRIRVESKLGEGSTFIVTLRK